MYGISFAHSFYSHNHRRSHVNGESICCIYTRELKQKLRRSRPCPPTSLTMWVLPIKMRSLRRHRRRRFIGQCSDDRRETVYIHSSTRERALLDDVKGMNPSYGRLATLLRRKIWGLTKGWKKKVKVEEKSISFGPVSRY